MKCENCGKKHDGKYGSGRFCSSKCARGFSTKSKRTEINKKVSKSLSGRKQWNRSKPETDNEKLIRIDKMKLTVETKKQQFKENNHFDDWCDAWKREHVYEKQLGKCAKCGIDEWLGEKIILELEHKDGDNQNNKEDNLEYLCPNCHSMTKTWRGRNKKEKPNRISDEEMIDALKRNLTIRQALLDLKISAKGGNYKRAKKLLNEMGV